MLVFEVVADMHHQLVDLLGSDLYRQDVPGAAVFSSGKNEKNTAVFLPKLSSNPGYSTKH